MQIWSVGNSGSIHGFLACVGCALLSCLSSQVKRNKFVYQVVEVVVIGQKSIHQSIDAHRTVGRKHDRKDSALCYPPFKWFVVHGDRETDLPFDHSMISRLLSVSIFVSWYKNSGTVFVFGVAVMSTPVDGDICTAPVPTRWIADGAGTDTGSCLIATAGVLAVLILLVLLPPM